MVEHQSESFNDRSRPPRRLHDYRLFNGSLLRDRSRSAELANFLRFLEDYTSHANQICLDQFRKSIIIQTSILVSQGIKLAHRSSIPSRTSQRLRRSAETSMSLLKLDGMNAQLIGDGS